LNVGVTFGVIVCTSVAVPAHCPPPGVNVYVPVVVLSIVAGFQVPVIGTAFVEDDGNAAAGEPLQIVGNALNVGVILLVTVCTSV
jgi:hypothetical protein